MSDENNINVINTNQGSDYKIKSQYLDNMKVNEMQNNINSGIKQSQNNIHPQTEMKQGNNSNYYDQITGSIPRYENDSVDEDVYDEVMMNAELENNKQITMNGYIVAPEENFVYENCQQKDNINNYFHIDNSQQYNQDKLENIHNYYVDDVINDRNYLHDDSMLTNNTIQDLDQKYDQQYQQRSSGVKNLLSSMQPKTNFNPNFVNNNLGGLNTSFNTNNNSKNINQNNNQGQNMNQMNNVNVINNTNQCDEINY
jgi:hypothetical protein